MKAFFDRFFNWKKRPASVFFIAIPVAVLAFGLHLIYAILMAQQGKFGYLVIYFAGIALLIFGLWPIRRQIFESITRE